MTYADDIQYVDVCVGGGTITRSRLYVYVFPQSAVLCEDKYSRAPVSYTHLDVYKRQLQLSAAHSNVQFEILQAPVRHVFIVLQRFEVKGKQYFLYVCIC